jgi:hypothetical protein
MIRAVGCCLQSFSIGNDNLLSRKADERSLLEVVKGDCNPGPPYLEHQRQKFVRERDLVASQPAVGREKQRAKRSSRVALPFDRAVLAVWFMKLWAKLRSARSSERL